MSVAYSHVQRKLQLVLSVGILLGVATFGPQVARIGRVAADAQRDQVIFFVVARIGVGVSVLPKQGSLKSVCVERPARRTVLVQPFTKTVLLMFSCVTSGLIAPGVSVESGRSPA
jgi:hypothetical protein